MNRYRDIMSWINYGAFLLLVASLPFPQIFLRYTIVVWLITWLLEGRWISKPTWRWNILPFVLFAAWYIWDILSGTWSQDMHLWHNQIERYMVFGCMLPIALWGVNKHYNWHHICRVLVVSCVVATIAYIIFIPWSTFPDSISEVKHRLFLCATEIFGIMCAIYIRKDYVDQYGPIWGNIWTILSILIMAGMIVITQSRASLFVAIVLIGVAIVYRIKPRYRSVAIVGILVAVMGIGVAVFNLHPRMKDMKIEQLDIQKLDPWREPRLNIWGMALEHPEDYSTYGLGAGQSTPYLVNIYRKKGYDYYVTHSFHPHNQYLKEWMELGIGGLILFILAWVTIPLCNHGLSRKTAFYLVLLYGLNMFTDCAWGKFDGIALWAVWMLLILLQSDRERESQSARD